MPATPEKNSAHILPYQQNWALFLDVDGTLIDIATDPYHVQLKPGTNRLIKQLYAHLHGALALISGRRLSDLDRLFAMPELPAAGLHGMEHRISPDEPAYIESVDESVMNHFRNRLHHFTSQHSGLLLEDKGLSIAVHFRHAPELQIEVEKTLAQVIDGYGTEFHIQNGKMVAELKSRHFNKGRTIKRFIREKPFSGRTPVFIGDDITDEDGFAVTNDIGGISIKVGHGETCALYRLPEPADVIVWLERYLRFLSSDNGKS